MSIVFILENKPKKELVRILQQRGYDSDPVKSWKEAQNKLEVSAFQSISPFKSVNSTIP